MLLFTKYIHYVDECTVCYIDLGIHTTRGKDTGSDLRNTEVEGRNEETTGWERWTVRWKFKSTGAGETLQGIDCSVLVCP